MNSLILWASICGVVTVLITLYGALYQSAHGGQSMRDSMLETWTNIAIGFTINYFANLVVLPLAGFDISHEANFLIGIIYTFISVARQFIIRRAYNLRMVRKP